MDTSKLKKEFKKLKEMLQGMGCYEIGMTLEDMRQLSIAVEQSKKECRPTCSQYSRRQRLLSPEGKVDLVSPNAECLSRSTRIRVDVSPSPTVSTVGPQLERVDVHAQVHHTADWSPPNEIMALQYPGIPYIDEDISCHSDVETFVENDQTEKRSSSHLIVPNIKLMNENSYSSVEHSKSTEEKAEDGMKALMETEDARDENVPPKISNISTIDDDVTLHSPVVDTNGGNVEPEKNAPSHLTVPSTRLRDDDSSNSVKDDESMEKSVGNGAEISASNLHETESPLSEHRIQDSSSMLETPSSFLCVPYNALKNLGSSTSLQDAYSMEKSIESSVEISTSNLQETRSSASERTTQGSSFMETPSALLRVPYKKLKEEDSYNSSLDADSMSISSLTDRRALVYGFTESYDRPQSSLAFSSSTTPPPIKRRHSISSHDIQAPITIRIIDESDPNLNNDDLTSSWIAIEHSSSSVENSPEKRESQAESNQNK